MIAHADPPAKKQRRSPHWTFVNAIKLLEEGKDEEAAIILEKKGKVDSKEDIWGAAIHYNGFRCAELCLKYGVNIKRDVGDFGTWHNRVYSPLSYAETDEMALWLLERGAVPCVNPRDYGVIETSDWKRCNENKWTRSVEYLKPVILAQPKLFYTLVYRYDNYHRRTYCTSTNKSKTLQCIVDEAPWNHMVAKAYHVFIDGQEVLDLSIQIQSLGFKEIHVVMDERVSCKCDTCMY